MQFIRECLKTNWIVGLVLTLLFLTMSEKGWFDWLDRHAFNLGSNFSTAKDPHDDIVIVAIDDQSLHQLGAWPWSRNLLAKTTDIISQAEPKVIGFNLPLESNQFQTGLTSLSDLRSILTNEKKLNRRVNQALRLTEVALLGDDNLARSFFKSQLVVLSMPYIRTDSFVGKPDTPLPQNIRKFTLPNVSPMSYPKVQYVSPTPNITHAQEVFPPLNKLANQAVGIGVISDVEQFFKEPLLVRYGQDFLPSFALMMTARSKGLTVDDIESWAEVSPMLDGKDLGADIDFQIYPRFYQNGNAAFKTISVADVLDGTVERNELQNKIVLVGLTSPRVAPSLLSPEGDPISTTLATAHTLSSLLNREFFRMPDTARQVRIGLIIALGLYFMFGIQCLRANTALYLTTFTLLVLINTHFILMSSQAIWFPMMAVFVMLLVGHFFLEARHIMAFRMQNMRDDLSQANRQLGQAFQAQGQLDQAFEKFRASDTDETLLLQVYNLGLDYERKRQFNKAVSAFKFIQNHDRGYNDVKDRIGKNEDAANSITLQGASNSGPSPSLLSNNSGVQKPKLGRYEIGAEIGKGAMGMVYLGRDEKIGRTVAIKTMLISDESDSAARDSVKKRFFREAEAAGRLNHPNIVTVYDVGDEQELAYIAMDYLPGKDLSAYITLETLLPVSQVFQIATNVALALDYAHQQKVVHRDIKPANIIYDPKKRSAKITDFGVAHLTDASKTRTGTVVGSPYYMAPEQLSGKKVDGRADLFSLGVTLFQMLTSELPFNGDSMANLMYNIANEPHPDIRNLRGELPNCICAVINKALQKEADKRFQTGREMGAAMNACRPHIKEMEVA